MQVGIYCADLFNLLHETYLFGATKTHISNLKKNKIATVMAKVIDNFQLKYWNICAVWNPWAGNFSFSASNCLNVATKIHIFNLKNNYMATVIAIIIDNLQLQYWKACAVQNLFAGSFAFSLCIFPLRIQQKQVFKNFLKFNVAAITATIINYFHLVN